MRSILLIAGLLLGPSAMAIEAPPKISAVSGTLVQTLDGEWTTAEDPKNEGLNAKWFEAASFPSTGTKTAQVPGSVTEQWDVAGEWTGAPDRIFWYRRTFTAKTSGGAMRDYLRFGAIRQSSDIWINGVSLGHHDTGEDPFEFDVTSQLQLGKPNTVVVRVATALVGGIYEHVDLVEQPKVRILDVFARPDAQAKSIHLEITLENNTQAASQVSLAAALGEFKPAHELGTEKLTATAQPGKTVAKLDLPVAQPHWWNLDDPFLYTVKVSSSDASGKDAFAFHAGFRDFRVKDGYFTLNGKRIIVKSLHGNYCDPIYTQANGRDWTYMGRDFPQLKNAGFNMMRMIMSAALPEQLEQADQMGFLIFAEHETSWMCRDPEKFGRTIEAIARRDRNHPSLVMWGMLNETDILSVYHRAKDFLPTLRAVDDTRPVLMSSGRWDKDTKTASLSNPGSSTWDVYMGGEDPVSPKPTGPMPELGAYRDGTGDAHIYPLYPMSWEVVSDFNRIDAANPHPMFVSESGIGSSYDPFDEQEQLKKADAPVTCPSWRWANEGVNGFTKAWKDYALAGTYATPSAMLKDSALEAAQQRALIFSAIRGNPKINGYSLTSLQDFYGAGEGVVTNFRDYKAGHLPVLRAGWAHLRWSLLLDSQHIYTDQRLHVRVALANEDELGEGGYPATISITGPGGTAWKKQVTIAVQKDGPLAYPVIDEDVTVPNLKAGEYALEASLDGRANAAAAKWPFTVSDRAALPKLSGSVTVLGVRNDMRDLLTKQGAQVRDYAGSEPAAHETIVVGGDFHGSAADWRGLYTRAARGAHLVFLAPQIFKQDKEDNHWLALAQKGKQNTAPDWLYHKDVVARVGDPLFAGLQTKLMTPEYYGELLGHTSYFQDIAARLDSATIALYSSLTDRYHFIDGVMLGTYPFHAGHFTINSLNIVNTIGLPATDRLLINIVAAAQKDAAPLGNAPVGLDAELDQLGLVAPSSTAGGWVKSPANPVVAVPGQVVFDNWVLRDGDKYRLWFSNGTANSIQLIESADGVHFTGAPQDAIVPLKSGWEGEVNRPTVVKREDGYHMWYTAETPTAGAISYATSPDGVHWTRVGTEPVLKPEVAWEKQAAICPDVMWDADAKVYKMWYSAGPRPESDAIGYATSPDGITWTKDSRNPIFTGDKSIAWEQERGVGCDVRKQGDWYYMFYIGFHDIGHAQLGIARSRDGITGWERLPQNPIVQMGTGECDESSCYKPSAFFDGSKWMLWYGARNGSVQTIALATHDGADLGFLPAK